MNEPNNEKISLRPLSSKSAAVFSSTSILDTAVETLRASNACDSLRGGRYLRKKFTTAGAILSTIPTVRIDPVVGIPNTLKLS